MRDPSDWFLAITFGGLVSSRFLFAPDSWATVAFAVPLIVLAAIHVLVCVLEIVISWNALGPPSLRRLRAMWRFLKMRRLELNTRFVMAFSTGALGTMMLKGQLLDGSAVRAILGVALVLAAPTMVLSSMHPPFVVMLGASTVNAYHSQLRISRASWPLRTVSMMQPVHTNESGLFGLAVRANMKRVGIDHDWVAAINLLIEAAYVVAIDTRARSSLVAQEIGLLFESAQQRRLFFIVNERAEDQLITELRGMLGRH